MIDSIKADWKDAAWKAANTFWQSFAVVFVASDWATAKTTFVAAVAAGLSAVKTFVSEYIKTRV